MALIAGQPEPFHHRAKKGIKGAGVITAGSILVVDTALTPDGWKVAPTTATTKPFGVLINGDAATGDTTISVLVEGEVNVVADGVIEPNTPVATSTATAGRVVTIGAGTEANRVGLYLGDKGGSSPEAAAQGDVIRIIKEAE
jgi:hypothetical protein